MKHENIILKVIGILFIAFGISAYVNSLQYGTPGQVFWFCYFALVFIGIGILIKKSSIVLTQLNIVTIPLLIWIIDFFYVLITKGTLFGITNYFFIGGPIAGKIISLQHIFTIPLAIFSLYLLKIKREDLWKFSFIEMALIFVISKLFTAEEYNINCVYRNCMNFSLGPLWFHPYLWLISAFLLVFITNRIFMSLRFIKDKTKL